MSDIPITVDRELPRFSLRQIDLPDVLDWQVGGQYYLIVKVEETGVHNMSYLPDPQDQKLIEADFKMLGVKALGYDAVDLKSVQQQDFERAMASALSGE